MQMSVVDPPSTEDPCHETCHEPEVKLFASSNQAPDCEPTVVYSTEQTADVGDCWNPASGSRRNTPVDRRWSDHVAKNISTDRTMVQPTFSQSPP